MRQSPLTNLTQSLTKCLKISFGTDYDNPKREKTNERNRSRLIVTENKPGMLHGGGSGIMVEVGEGEYVVF